MAYPFKVKKGLLHKKMGVKQGEPIPVAKMQAAMAPLHKKAMEGTLSAAELKKLRELQFAMNAKKFKHK